MIKTFTQNDLIRYIYQETSEEETREIHNALICESELQQQYTELLQTQQSLTEAQMTPRASVVQNILDYARGLQEKR
jgi:hypothetical protein